MNGGPSGFNNAPVTRLIVVACALFTIIFGIQGRTKNIVFSYQDIFKKLQLWKLIVSAFGFSSTPELIFGAYLLYYFRVFERQIGSNKYIVFVLFSFIVSFVIHVLVLRLLKDPTLQVLTSGPYGLIFSLFVPFYFDIPISTRFSVSSLKFSDKTFIYLAGLQLLLSSWKRSILLGICGILAGSLYHLNVFRIRRIKFPDSVASSFSRLSWPTMGNDISPARSSTNSFRNVPSLSSRNVEPNYPVSVPMVTLEPDEESIAMLVAMGFDRNTARQALIRARNDVNAATNILLESQAH